MSPEPKWSGRNPTDTSGGGGSGGSLTDLTDVTGTPGPGKSPVYDDTNTAPLTHVVTQADLDALIREIRIELTPTTPNAIGKPGITIETLKPGDILITDQYFVAQPWDGNAPTLFAETDLHPDLNSNSIDTANDWQSDGTVTTGASLLGGTEPKMFNQADTIRVYVANNNTGGDPNATTGTVVLLLRVVPATATITP